PTLFFHADDGIRDFHVLEFRRVLFRSSSTWPTAPWRGAGRYGARCWPRLAPWATTWPTATSPGGPCAAISASATSPSWPAASCEIGRAACRESVQNPDVLVLCGQRAIC